MKRTLLFLVLCTVTFAPTRAFWSYKYWYCPVSWKEARVYFQIGLGEYTHTDGVDYAVLYVAGEGPLPDSNENNTTTFDFEYAYGYLSSSRLPWRQGGDLSEISYGAFIAYEVGSFRRVTVDKGITHIGSWWFAGLVHLWEAVMPLSLQSIGEGAFKGCSGLLYFYCFDNVKTIGIRAFEGCGNLSEFIRYENASDDGHYYNISEAPLNIGNRAFADCGSLKNFKIPANSTLGDEVFKNSAIESVDLGNNVKFGSNAFQDCKNFKQFTVPANYTLKDNIFVNSCLETVTVNDNVTFGKYSFRNCTNLKSITFQGRINAVTEGMFQDCSSLTSVNIPNGATFIGDYAFSGTFSLRTLNLPNSVTFIGAHAFNASGITSINIPNSVTSIGEYAFNNTKKLTSVTIPNSVTKIGERAFKQSGLTSITVSGSVKDLPYAMCSWCGNLTSVKLGEGVKIIGPCAFQDGWILETVSLPASLDSIAEWAFTRCNNLKVIECNGMIPPAKMNSNAFAESDLTETSLCVPYGSVDAYRNAPVWKNFKNIGTYPAGIHIINGENFTVNSGSKIKLTAKLLPHDAVPAIVWTSSNSSMASVVDGTVTAHAEGEAVITATTINGIFKDSCKITVKPGNI